MQNHFYEITFTTKKDGRREWVRIVYAHSKKEALERVRELWKEDTATPSFHMFNLSARRMLATETASMSNFAIRERQVAPYVSDGRVLKMAVADHGAPYTHELVRGCIGRHEHVHTDSGLLTAPGVSCHLYSLWCIRDYKDAIVAYDWEM